MKKPFFLATFLLVYSVECTCFEKKSRIWAVLGLLFLLLFCLLQARLEENGKEDRTQAFWKPEIWITPTC